MHKCGVLDLCMSESALRALSQLHARTYLRTCTQTLQASYLLVQSRWGALARATARHVATTHMYLYEQFLAIITLSASRL